MSKYAGKLITNQAPAGYSVFFDGSGDYLSLTQSAFAVGTSNFTLEAWVYLTAAPGTEAGVISSFNTGGGQGFYLAVNSSRQPFFAVGNGAVSNPTVTGTAISLNTWVHLAGVRSSGTLTLYVNGTSVGTPTSATASIDRTLLGIGLAYPNSPQGYITGYISNARVTSSAVYTAAFTPPTQLLNVTNTQLLTCNSPAIVDQSSNAFAITVNGNAAVSTFTPFTAYVPYNPALGASTPGVWTLDEAMQAAATRQWNMYDPSFQNTTLLLHGNGTNGAQNNTFLDSSSNNFTITRNGNTTQGSFSPFSQTGWSNFFNGTNSDVLEVPNNVAFDFGTSDVTVETWVYLNSTSAIQNLIDVGPSSGSGFTSWTLDITASGFIRFGSYVSGTYQATEATSNALLPNQWYHIAFTRSAGTNRLFVNGVVCAATGTFTQAINSGGNTLMIGRGKYSGFTRPTTGYFSSVRIVKGTAVYTNNFTPSAVPLTAISGTSLLTCQSNRFVDNSTNNFTLTPSGTPSVQAFSPFYPTAAYTPQTIGGSGYFDGSGDYLRIATGAPLNFGSSNFTVEFWIYPMKLGAAMVFLSSKSDGTQTGDVDIRCDYITTTVTTFYINIGGAFLSAGFTGNILNRWTHVAVARNGSTITAYFNGVVSTSATGSTQGTSFLSAVNIGGGSGLPTAGYEGVTGYMAGLRVINGSAAYTAAFTPPTLPPTAITNTSLLTNFTNAGIVDSTAKNVLETVGNAQISTTQSKFGGSSIAFDGTGDYLFIPQSNNPLNINWELVNGDFTIEFWFRANTVSPTAQGLIVKFNGNAGARTDIQYLISLSGSNLNCNAYQSTANNDITFTSAISINTWYHVAFVRSGNSFSAYLDGTRNATVRTITGALNSGTNWPLQIGRYTEGGVNYDFNGYIDDLRITKGIARYTANFTPQTSQWQDQ